MRDEPAVRKPRRWRHAKRLACALITLFVLWLAIGALAAWQLTRRPRPAFVESAPLVAGQRLQDHRLRTSDGEDIGAWHLPPRDGRGTVLFLHGIGGSRSTFLPLMNKLVRDGYGVMSISLRCHGDSTGSAHDAGYSARRDVIAAVHFLQNQQPAPRIVVCGSSFGAAAAAYAAPELGERVHAYVFDSLYADLCSTIWNRCDHYLPAGIDYTTYGALRLWAPVFLPESLDVLHPAKCVAQIPARVRVVLAVGTADFRSPPADARAMYASVKSHGELVEFPGAGHSLLHVSDEALYVRTLENLFTEARGD